MDQLESTVPGLVTQLKGISTKIHYQAATIFIDHYSKLSYMHLQKSLMSKEMVQVKQAFEVYAKSHEVLRHHYHADNRCFQGNAFRNAVEQAQQTLSFCGVNAHFQNGIAEKRIRDLQDNARTMLPQAINTYQWPYTL